MHYFIKKFKNFNKILLDLFCQQNFIIKKIGQFYRWSCYMWQLYKIWYLNDAKMLIRYKRNIIFYFI